MKELKPIQLYEEFNSGSIYYPIHPGFFDNVEDIKRSLAIYDITKYTILDDLSVNVDQEVNLNKATGGGAYYSNRSFIKINFNRSHSFGIHHECLSLKGLPIQVNGVLDINGPLLRTLEYLPAVITGTLSSRFPLSTLLHGGYETNLLLGEEANYIKIPENIKENEISNIPEIIKWLPVNGDVKRSLNWTRRVNEPLYYKIIEYSLEHQIDLSIDISPEVKAIATAALKGNHKLR